MASRHRTHAAGSAPAGPAGRRIAPFGWHPALCHERTPTEPGCQPAVLERLIYTDPEAAAAGDYSSYSHPEYLPACHGCEWRGVAAESENEATEAAHDHAFPGWRSLPVLPHLPSDLTERQRGELLVVIDRLYPNQWVERHGPVLTRRSPIGTRHVPNRAPTGGYDMAGAIEEAPSTTPEPTQQSLF